MLYIHARWRVLCVTVVSFRCVLIISSSTVDLWGCFWCRVDGCELSCSGLFLWLAGLLLSCGWWVSLGLVCVFFFFHWWCTALVCAVSVVRGLCFLGCSSVFLVVSGLVLWVCRGVSCVWSCLVFFSLGRVLFAGGCVGVWLFGWPSGWEALVLYCLAWGFGGCC